MAWIDNYCRAHPLNKLDEASGELLVELGRKIDQRGIAASKAK
jgi:hypothetical protein